VIAVDSNILVYAHRDDAPFHQAAVELLGGLAESGGPWAIPWPCVHEFLAVSTSRKAYSAPSRMDVALGFMDALLGSPQLRILHETAGHWAALRTLLDRGNVWGGMIHDARIAAICIEHGVSALWSADRDFRRFPSLKVVNPLAGH
jgi:toxin-antitoxin system PIN domain toxin